jgi:RNA polymerase sigma-70 factor (ECF subfamily)
MEILPSEASCPVKGGRIVLEETVACAQARDAEAFTELVERYQDAVFGSAYHVVLDFEAARDIAQETFVRAWERLPELRDPAAFPAWLLRICRNLAVSWRRSPERDLQRLDADGVADDDLAERVATRDLVSRALSALPANNRLALTLFLVDGYTYDEVAALTEAPLTTVKGRIERGRRQLEAEVLAMTEETLKGEAPDEQFTEETVRRSLDEAQAAVQAHEMGEARAAAEEVLERLADLDADDEERREIEFDALGVVKSATFFQDPERWLEATRRQIRILEQRGDREQLALHLSHLGAAARTFTQSERVAIAEYCIALYEELGMLGMLGNLRSALFFRGWHLAMDGEPEPAKERWERASALSDVAGYDDFEACLDATREFLRITGGRRDLDRRVNWRAAAAVLMPEGDRLTVGSQPGQSSSHSTFEENAAAEDGFLPFSRIGWLPVTDPEVGHEEERASFSYSPHPMRMSVWVPSDEETVSTPAGEFDGCLLVRATISLASEDRQSEAREAESNKLWAGEWCWWFARGVGPVAFRHEAENGITAHTLLSRFECPEEREEWFPLVVGTRWEWQPADPIEGIDVQMVNRLTHISEDGNVYLATTTVAQRTGV